MPVFMTVGVIAYILTFLVSDVVFPGHRGSSSFVFVCKTAGCVQLAVILEFHKGCVLPLALV